MGYESPAVYSAEPAYNITGSAEDFVHHPNLCVPIIHVQLIQAYCIELGTAGPRRDDDGRPVTPGRDDGGGDFGPPRGDLAPPLVPFQP